MGYKISTFVTPLPLSKIVYAELLLFPLSGRTASTTMPTACAGKSCFDGTNGARKRRLAGHRRGTSSSSSTSYKHGGNDRGEKRKEEERIWSEGGQDSSRTRARHGIYAQMEEIAAIITRPSL